MGVSPLTHVHNSVLHPNILCVPCWVFGPLGIHLVCCIPSPGVPAVPLFMCRIKPLAVWIHICCAASQALHGTLCVLRWGSWSLNLWVYTCCCLASQALACHSICPVLGLWVAGSLSIKVMCYIPSPCMPLSGSCAGSLGLWVSGYIQHHMQLRC